MKKQLLIFLLCLPFLGFGQQLISNTLLYDGNMREYDVYVPAAYDGTTSVPLLFNFHGGNGDIASQLYTSDMRPIADTANFIVVYPQALEDPNDGNSTNWLHKDPTTHDDIYFVERIIDTLSAQYMIDASRVYACGYSLGGEFTFELACRLSNKITAIAVVARTMQQYQHDICDPQHPTAVMTILGTDDQISSYNGLVWGGITYYIPADDTHLYWATINNTDSNAITITIPDINSADGSTVDSRRWENGDNCVAVEELRVNNGGHDWPGSFGNMDINSNTEIWNFVSKYDMSGLIGCNISSTSLVNDNPKKELVNLLDVLGRESKQVNNQLLFYLYNDGTVEKRIIIE